MYQQLETACQAELRACKAGAERAGGGSGGSGGEGGAEGDDSLLARLARIARYFQLAAVLGVGMLVGNQLQQGLLLAALSRLGQTAASRLRLRPSDPVTSRGEMPFSLHEMKLS